MRHTMATGWGQNNSDTAQGLVAGQQPSRTEAGE